MNEPLTLEELRELQADLGRAGGVNWDWMRRAVLELIAIRERPVDAIADAATIKTNRVKTGP